jgi:hypothetical protein
MATRIDLDGVPPAPDDRLAERLAAARAAAVPNPAPANDPGAAGRTADDAAAGSDFKDAAGAIRDAAAALKEAAQAFAKSGEEMRQRAIAPPPPGVPPPAATSSMPAMPPGYQPLTPPAPQPGVPPAPQATPPPAPTPKKPFNPAEAARDALLKEAQAKQKKEQDAATQAELERMDPARKQAREAKEGSERSAAWAERARKGANAVGDQLTGAARLDGGQAAGDAIQGVISRMGPWGETVGAVMGQLRGFGSALEATAREMSQYNGQIAMAQGMADLNEKLGNIERAAILSETLSETTTLMNELSESIKDIQAHIIRFVGPVFNGVLKLLTILADGVETIVRYLIGNRDAPATADDPILSQLGAIQSRFSTANPTRTRPVAEAFDPDLPFGARR